jgi:hypothetical protein
LAIWAQLRRWSTVATVAMQVEVRLLMMQWLTLVAIPEEHRPERAVLVQFRPVVAVASVALACAHHRRQSLANSLCVEEET